MDRTKRHHWTFDNYIEQIIILQEIIEINEVVRERDKLIYEVVEKFPKECAAKGIQIKVVH